MDPRAAGSAHVLYVESVVDADDSGVSATDMNTGDHNIAALVAAEDDLLLLQEVMLRLSVGSSDP